MGKVSESIFSGDSAIIPMAEVHHIERDKREGFTDAIIVVLNGTTWNNEIDAYNNSIWLRHEEAESFIKCWCRYRYELESETIMNLQEDIPGFNIIICVDGLEKITIGDLQEIFSINEMSMKEAMPIMRAFRYKHGLTDKQALNAFVMAKHIFDA